MIRRAIIVGGSVAGLSAAAMLARAGWHVQVFEKAGTELEGRGAGIATHAELHRAMARAGCDVSQLGPTVADRVVFDLRGEVIESWQYEQVFTAWGRVYKLLRAQVPAEAMHYGISFSGFEQAPAPGVPVRARFTDGVTREADLLVAADGLRSAVRTALAPEVQPEYAGYVAWRGMVEENRISRRTLDTLVGKFGFCIPPGEQMIGYPVAGMDGGVDTGLRRFSFVWYRPADEEDALPRLMTGIDGVTYPSGIAPHLLDPRHIAQMRADAQRLLAPQFAEIVALTAQPLIQPIFDQVVPRMAYGNVAIMGDAAFVARPHCGMGVTKAVSDGCALADALVECPSIPEALARFEAARMVEGRRAVDLSRQLGAYMQAQTRTDEERVQAEKYRTPHAIIRNTAVALH